MTHSRQRKPRHCERGFTLIESILATALFAIAVLGAFSTTVYSTALGKVNEEAGLANAAVQRVIEEMQTRPFGEIFALFNADPLDDPAGPGTAPGPQFTVRLARNLNTVAGLLHGPRTATHDLQAVIEFPSNPLDPQALREDAVSPELGLPTDLNGDGVIDGADHKGDYRMLPVVVRVQWQGVGGPRTLRIPTLLANR